MVKKILALALICALAFTFAACEPKADESGLRIAIVTSPSGVDDGSFNQNNYEGIQAFIANHPGATVTATREPTGDTAACMQAINDIIADYDVIVTPGFQFAGVGEIAKENPDKKFILIDEFPTDADFNNYEVENVYAMKFAEQESGFLAGIAAALESKTGKVGFVGGIAYPAVVNYQFGFESGVYYANKNLGASAEIVNIAAYAGTDVTGANVGGNYVGDFADEATGKVIGQALIAEGCDILFVAAGGSGNGAFTAAKESNGAAMVIGCDVDQFNDGVIGDKNVVLTSALKVMDINVERQLNAIADGSFAGGNVTLYADTDSTGIVTEEGRHQCAAATITELNNAYAAIKDGSIVPAANFNGVTPDSFK